MIAALVLTAQTMVTVAPPIEVARAATTWSCQFVGTDTGTFELNGYFAEAPVGSDPNVSMPTQVKGNGPSHFLGAQRYNAFDSFPDLRSYMITRQAADRSDYTILFNLVKDENLGLATITRFAADTTDGNRKLAAYAVGTCSASFHPLGHLETRK